MKRFLALVLLAFTLLFLAPDSTLAGRAWKYRTNNGGYYSTNYSPQYYTNPYNQNYNYGYNGNTYSYTPPVVQETLWDLLSYYARDISKSVTDTSDGITMTLTSSDRYVSSRLQTIDYEFLKSEIGGRYVSIYKVNHWDGAEVRVSSSDTDTVYKIRDHIRTKLGFPLTPRPSYTNYPCDNRYSNTCCNNCYQNQYNYNYNQNYSPDYYAQNRNTVVSRSYSNIPGGSTIVITSTDPTMINYIQSYPRGFIPDGLGNYVSTSISNVSLGIQINITSSYYDVIDRIQRIVNSGNYTTPNGYYYR